MPTKEKSINVQFGRYFEKMADKTTRLLGQPTSGVMVRRERRGVKIAKKIKQPTIPADSALR